MYKFSPSYWISLILEKKIDETCCIFKSWQMWTLLHVLDNNVKRKAKDLDAHDTKSQNILEDNSIFQWITVQKCFIAVLHLDSNW